ncbi:oxygenase MpaB family protein [Lentzea tibetensis]|nr:oxygenase MpaB family protein [Lentzea tibetensis]
MHGASSGEVAEPLGPDSLAWRYCGDWRVLLLLGRVGYLQLMYPPLSAGVIDHSAFYAEPWDRVLRSLPAIAGLVYDGPAAARTAHRVRDLHAPVEGIDHRGVPYRALDPRVFFWAFATITENVITVIDAFDHRMGPAEREAFYQEMVRCWRQFGLGTREVPADYPAFRRYFDRMCEEELELTPAARRFRDVFNRPGISAQPWVPARLWRLVAPLAALPRALSVVALPPALRRVLGHQPTAVQKSVFWVTRTLVRLGWPLLPRGWRYMERARVAFSRLDG